MKSISKQNSDLNKNSDIDILDDKQKNEPKESLLNTLNII